MFETIHRILRRRRIRRVLAVIGVSQPDIETAVWQNDHPGEW